MKYFYSAKMQCDQQVREKNTFIMLQMIYISTKFWSFVLSIYQNNPEMYHEY